VARPTLTATATIAARVLAWLSRRSPATLNTQR
jgi:hypothetical protein